MEICGKKNPSTNAGVVSLFAVTHQGPAQGGKAGSSELPGWNLTKNVMHFNAARKNISTCAEKLREILPN
jgi:hypothetical protein